MLPLSEFRESYYISAIFNHFSAQTRKYSRNTENGGFIQYVGQQRSIFGSVPPKFSKFLFPLREFSFHLSGFVSVRRQSLGEPDGRVVHRHLMLEPLATATRRRRTFPRCRRCSRLRRWLQGQPLTPQTPLLLLLLLLLILQSFLFLPLSISKSPLK